jgi:O-antigen ligase
MKTQKYLFYLYIFSINFEFWDPFSNGIDFFITKVTASIFLLSTLVWFSSLYSLKGIKKYILPIVGFFLLLTLMSYLHRNKSYPVYFNMPLFLNILILIVSINLAKRYPMLFLNGLKVFLMSTMLITLMFLFGIQTEYTMAHRITIMDNNQNDLGIKLAITILFVYYLILKYSKKIFISKLLHFLAAILMFYFLVKTGSRSAFLSLLMGVIGFVLFYKQKNSPLRIVSIFLSMILFFIIWQFYLKDTNLANRIMATFLHDDISGRSDRWMASLVVFSKNNFYFGIGETGYAHQISSLLGFYSSPHNVILEVLCDTGLIGLFLFLLFFIRIAVHAFKVNVMNNEILSLILLLPIIVLIFSGQLLGTKIVWIIFGYIVSQRYLPYDKVFNDYPQ